MGKASRNKGNNKAIVTSDINTKDRFGLWVTVAVIVILAILATIIFLVNTNSQKANDIPASQVSPQGVLNDGIVIRNTGVDTSLKPTKIDAALTESEFSSDENNISAYIDYSCPHCSDFENANREQLDTWLKDETIDTLTIHPVAFLTEYSLNAANTFMCVAENAPEKALDVHYALTENYMDAPRGKGLVNLVSDTGVNMTDELETCIRGNKFEDFIMAATERAQTGPIPASTGVPQIAGTPTIIVNGKRYNNNPADANAFKEFVNSVLSGEEITENNDNTIGTTTPVEEGE